ncbi:MAG: hypothetical protein SNF33_05915 [Candidatus Algichlamydia australiensis]|nr:hypothetical protein [Chlamydiales bacterium]
MTAVPVTDESRCLEGQQVTVRGSLYESLVVCKDRTIQNATFLAKHIIIMPNATLSIKNVILCCERVVVLGKLKHKNLIPHLKGDFEQDMTDDPKEIEKEFGFFEDDSKRISSILKEFKELRKKD